MFCKLIKKIYMISLIKKKYYENVGVVTKVFICL